MTNNNRTRRRHVPTPLHWQARFFERTAPAWLRLARLESAVLREQIDPVEIKQPIYIGGVPRAGSTILTEILSRHPDVTSHRYSDFPNVYTPFWRNWLADRSRRHPPETVERAHRDRIKVSTESPEAVEEVIWMRFFKHLHDPETDQVLTETTENAEFERFYRDHIRKLLVVRNRSRYLAKGNYNTTRIRYILKLFPDARFVVPVRHPVNQIASLVKQDRLFDEANAEDPRVDRQLRMSGHYEFGPGRRPLRLGDTGDAESIAKHWRSGRSAVGWAIYWRSVYDQILNAMAQDREIAASIFLLRYEDLCRNPRTTLYRLVEHGRLDADRAEALIADYAERISEPDYYRPSFSDEEIKQLSDICHSSANRLGYDL